MSDFYAIQFWRKMKLILASERPTTKEAPAISRSPTMRVLYATSGTSIQLRSPSLPLSAERAPWRQTRLQAFAASTLDSGCLSG